MQAANEVHWWQYWGNVAQLAAVVVTGAAVIVALFKEDFIRRRRHPKLTASIEAKHPNCVRTSEKKDLPAKPWKGFTYFLRVWVKNQGNVRAEKVEVFLSQAWVRSNSTFEPVPNFTPMNLRWSYTHETYVEGISPGMGRLCDFASISDPAYFSPPQEKTRLSLCLQVPPPSTDRLSPGHYKFEIKLAGSNCEPVTCCIHLHLTGVWDNEPAQMLPHGFTVLVSSGCDSVSPLSAT
jgi:hypothetical protein